MNRPENNGITFCYQLAPFMRSMLCVTVAALTFRCVTGVCLLTNDSPPLGLALTFAIIGVVCALVQGLAVWAWPGLWGEGK